MKQELSPGLTGSASFIVEEKHLASAIGSGAVPVLSTPMMIAGMEHAAATLMEPYLEEGETTVGVHVDVSHKAATPLGMKASFQAELLEISANGKVLTFRAQAWDEAGLIGEGIHKRAIINKAKFEQNVMDKLAHKAQKSRA